MVATKLQSAEEFKRWYREGRSYAWIVATYLEKYNIQITKGAVANWRQRLGLEETRLVRNTDLMPWVVNKEHRALYPAIMLRAEGRRRAGRTLKADLEQRLDRWLAQLEESNAVVHYDSETEQGWWYVPREQTDTDIVRQPRRRRRSG